MITESEKAFNQGCEDFSNRVEWRAGGARYAHSPELLERYYEGRDLAHEYASEASLRYAESGAAYEAYLDAKSCDAAYYRQDEYDRWLDFHNAEFADSPDPEAEFVADSFMARVLAYGEDAQRESDREWKAGAPERKARMEAARRAAQEQMPF